MYENVDSSAYEAEKEAEIIKMVEDAEIEKWEKKITRCSLVGSGKWRSTQGKHLTEQINEDTGMGGLLLQSKLQPEWLGPLTALHKLITKRLRTSLAGWGGIGDKSGRQRGYGYFGSNPLSLAHYNTGQTMKELSGADAEADRAANRAASVVLDDSELPDGLDEALEAVTGRLRMLLPDKYKEYCRKEYLIAAQPNLHRGKRFLRPHLDEPINDGFGIIIVTIAISGNAKILMKTRPWAENSMDGWFPLSQGEAYCLSGDARNLCLHGVLAEGDEERESLNLRFGLHSAFGEGPYPCGLSAYNEIDYPWDQTMGLEHPDAGTRAHAKYLNKRCEDVRAELQDWIKNGMRIIISSSTSTAAINHHLLTRPLPPCHPTRAPPSSLPPCCCCIQRTRRL